MRLIDLSGKRFGRLQVMERAELRNNKPCWRCLCDCGVAVIIRGNDLRAGRTSSCGCLQRDRAAEIGHRTGAANSRAGAAKRSVARRHGHARRGYSRVYGIWKSMIQRCTNPRASKYGLYGDRGITVCAAWRRFENFYSAMGDPPSVKHTIDRIDGHRGYQPDNVRWATRGEQNRNRSNTIKVIIDGVSVSLSDAAERRGIPYSRAYYRLTHGWATDLALSASRRGNRTAPC